MVRAGVSAQNTKANHVSQTFIEPFSVIFADDIRKEVSGKEILIGVYSADIVVFQLPYTVRLALFIQIKVSGPGGLFSNKIRVTDPNENKAGETVIEQSIAPPIEDGEERVMAIILPPLSVTLAQPGFIKVFWSIKDDVFDLIAQKRVVVGKAPTSLLQPGQFSPGAPVS